MADAIIPSYELSNLPIVLKILAWAALGAIVLYFLWNFNTALCRDNSYDPAKNGELRPVKDRPYSFARVQLWWWSLIIIFCYGFFFALYGVLLELIPTVAILLGGPIAVFMTGKVIDDTQIENNNIKKEGAADGTATIPTRHQDLEKSKGFLTDILSDDSGISIHRLQAVAFNLIYGIGFLAYFFIALSNKNAYPFLELKTWQLTLLGISAAGYLGMKANENPPATKPERKAEAESIASAAAPRGEGNNK